MLSDQQRELITAFLDGEMGPHERKLALRLLRRSGEARALLQRLQEDSHSLQLLPERKLAPEFPQRVLHTIRERGLRPARPATLPFRSKTIPGWVGAAVAASILVLVGLGSYLVCDALYPPSHPGIEKVEVSPPTDKEKEEVKPKTEPLNPHLPNLAKGLVAECARQVEVQLLVDKAQRKALDALAKLGRPEVQLALKELRQPKAVKHLTEVLKRDNSYHLNLSVRDQGQVVQRLQTGLEKKGFQVFMDNSVRNRIKQPQQKPPATFVVYTENMQPEEMANLLEQLGKEDKIAANNSKMLLGLMSNVQRTEMARRLGVPVQDLEPPDKQGRIHLGTFVEMDPAIDKKGQGAPKVTPPPSKNRFAVVLAISPGANGNPMNSPAVRDFLAKRQAQRPGTLQVVMVVNQLA